MSTTTRPPAGSSAVSDTKFTPTQIRKIFAGAVGNSLEYVDWALYGLLAPVFAAQFFPEGDPVAALLSTLAVYAVGFVMRPVGGAVLGAFGDKHGRKAGLALSILIMAGGSIVIALAPTYSAIGIAAPIILLIGRLAQGFAAGGEYGASMSFMMESAPQNRRGLGGSFQQVSISAGILVASVISTLLTTVLSEEQMSSYGWRIGFLIVAALCIGAYLYRRNIGESETFEELESNDEVSESPMNALFTRHLRSVMWVFVIASPLCLLHYIWVTYLPAYANTTFDYPLNVTLLAQTVCTFMLLFVLPVFGYLSDRIGRKPLLLFATGASVLLSWPAFALIGQGIGWYFLTQILMVLLLAPFNAVLTSVLAEHVPAKVRTTGIGFPYAIAVAVFGGTAPLIITAMAENGFGSFVWIYPAAMALAAVIAFSFLKETAFSPLDGAEKKE